MNQLSSAKIGLNDFIQLCSEHNYLKYKIIILSMVEADAILNPKDGIVAVYANATMIQILSYQFYI